jgi:hypothetical protein
MNPVIDQARLRRGSGSVIFSIGIEEKFSCNFL